MKRVVIFLNGILPNPSWALKVVRSSDIVIAVDGGAKHCDRLKIRPSYVIGDLDSISPKLLKKYQFDGIKIFKHPSKKNKTDFELALDLAILDRAGELLILGGAGGRLDMVIANILALTSAKLAKLKISMLTDTEELLIIRPGETTIKGFLGNVISLIPLTPSAHGVTLKGFKYPLNNEILYFGQGRGVSNIFKRKTASIGFKRGVMLAIQSRRKK